MNEAAFRRSRSWGLAYASDTRGSGPFVPSVDGAALGRVQLPTTLPTLDELIGLDGIDEGNVVRHLLGLTARDRSQVHHPARRARGQALASVFSALLRGWQDQGHRLGALDDAYRSTDPSLLVRRPVDWGSVPGRSGEVVGPVD